MAIQIEKSADRSGDSAWLEERHRELLGATIGARNATFVSNLGAWVLIAFACMLLPNRQDFLFPLALRLGSMMTTIALSRKSLTCVGLFAIMKPWVSSVKCSRIGIPSRIVTS